MVPEQLDIAFHPRSIAVVGASGEPSSLGHGFVLHLVTYGFQGPVYPVTPNWDEILGLKTYLSLSDIPESVDFAICCLPAAMVPDFLRECPGKGVRVVHLFTGRFSETGQEDAADQEEELKNLARELGIRLIGPNCMGIYNPGQGIAFGYDFPTESGRMGGFFQSGSSAAEVVYYCSLRGIRFTKAVSYGNALDIDESDILEYLGEDRETEVVAGYVEGVKDGTKFMHALRRTTSKKPVVLLKAGRSNAGVEAAASHTASLAGSFAIWESAVKQAGAVTAATLADLVDLAVAFYFLPPMLSNRVGVVGGGGGQSVLSADEWEEAGFSVVPLPDDIEEMIKKTMPELWWGWIRNPVDVSLLPAEAMASGLSTKIMKMMSQSQGIDLVVANIAVGGPFSKAFFAAYATTIVEEIIEVAKNSKPIVVVLDAGAMGPDDFGHQRWQSLIELRSRLVSAGIPVYPSASRAAHTIIRLIRYYQWKESLRK